MHGDLMRVRACLAAGADPDAEDEKGMTAGALAAEKGHKDIVEELREANRDDFVHRDDGWEVPPTGGFPEEPMSNAEDGPSSKRPKKGKSAQSRRLMLAQEAAEDEEQYEEEEEEEDDDEPDSPPRRGQDERARIMMGKARRRADRAARGADWLASEDGEGDYGPLRQAEAFIGRIVWLGVCAQNGPAASCGGDARQGLLSFCE